MKFKNISGTLIGCDPEALEYLASLDEQAEVLLVPEKVKQRTKTQNNALHLYCKLLADALNDAGLDMRRVLKEEVDIPWTEKTVKENLWKPIQLIVLDKESTTEPLTSEYDQVYSVIHRQMAAKHGVNVLWPSYLDMGR